MWPVGAEFLAALRQPCTITSTASHRNLVTGVVTPLDIVDGAVTVDRAATNRRVLSLTVPAVESTFRALDTPGGEITVRQALRFASGQQARVPLGVFIVDQDDMGYGAGDTATITAPDRSLKVQRNGFGPTGRSSVASNAAWQEIKRLVEGAWPGSTYPFPGWSQLDTSATTKVGYLYWDDGDRWGAAASLAAANGLQVFFDAVGGAVLRPIPQLTDTSTPVWTVNASTTDAVMTAASRSRDRSTMRNAVIATTSRTDITFLPQEKKNTTVGDPYSVTGPLGYVPLQLSGAYGNSAQAAAAALKELSLHLGASKQLTLEAASNPALDAEDVIKAVLPKIDPLTSRPTELHIIDSVTHPLVQSSGATQQILTRTTRPASDGT